ncbi:MAG: carboxypeptidase-like regulatory domain-containing protein [Candidatus Hydrogenedentales bacterium]|jgi:hypothetical protein
MAHKSNVPIVVIVLLCLAAGGWFVWRVLKDSPLPMGTNTTPETHSIVRDEAQAPIESSRPEEPLAADAGQPASAAEEPIVPLPDVAGTKPEPEIEGGLTIDGIVVTQTELGEVPVPNAAIFVGQRLLPQDSTTREQERLALSSADGTFHARSLSPSNYYVYALHPDYAPGWLPITPEPGATIEVRIVLSKGGTLEGAVTVGGQPVEGVSVHVESNTEIARGYTGPDGTYQLTRVTPGEFTVGTQLDGGKRSLVQLAVVVAGQTTRVDFAFGGATSAVQGIVTVDGEPATKGSMRLSVATGSGIEERFCTTIQPNGKYLFSESPAGAATLQVSADLQNHRTASRQLLFSIPQGESVSQDVEISLKTLLRGDITIPDTIKDGVVLALRGDVKIERLTMEHLMSLESLVAASASVLERSFRFEGLDPGTYTVVVLAYPEVPGSDMEGLATLVAKSLFASAVVEVKEDAETVVDLTPTL